MTNTDRTCAGDVIPIEAPKTLLIRKAVIWAEIKSHEQEYRRLQKQIDELEQAKVSVLSAIENKLNESYKVADMLLDQEYEALVKYNL